MFNIESIGLRMKLIALKVKKNIYTLLLFLTKRNNRRLIIKKSQVTIMILALSLYITSCTQEISFPGSGKDNDEPDYDEVTCYTASAPDPMPGYYDGADIEFAGEIYSVREGNNLGIDRTYVEDGNIEMVYEYYRGNNYPDGTNFYIIDIFGNEIIHTEQVSNVIVEDENNYFVIDLSDIQVSDDIYYGIIIDYPEFEKEIYVLSLGAGR